MELPIETLVTHGGDLSRAGTVVRYHETTVQVLDCRSGRGLAIPRDCVRVMTLEEQAEYHKSSFAHERVHPQELVKRRVESRLATLHSTHDTASWR